MIGKILNNIQEVYFGPMAGYDSHKFAVKIPKNLSCKNFANLHNSNEAWHEIDIKTTVISNAQPCGYGDYC